jgi:hypothetical protein
MSDYQNEYEEVQRREKEFEKQNGEIGKMLWSILQEPFIDWLNDQGYFDDDSDDADLGNRSAPFPSMQADFDGLSLTIHQHYDTSTIYANLIEGRYVELRYVDIRVSAHTEDDDRKSFGFTALIDETTGEFDIFSCMVHRYRNMHAAYCELEPNNNWHASLRKDWDKFCKWLLIAFTAHKFGLDDYKVTNVRET